MASLMLFSIVFTVLTQSFSSVAAGKPDPLIRVTDDNWNVVLEGEWMVELWVSYDQTCTVGLPGMIFTVKSAGYNRKSTGSITVDSDNFLLFELYTITRLL